MKKLNLTLIAALTCACVYAQPNALNPTGNVGIGTTTPASTLDVVGTGRFTSVVTPTSGTGTEVFYLGGAGYIQAYNRTASTFVPMYIQGSSIGFSNVGVASTNPSMIISGGKVGIGITNPLTRLHIVGSGSSIDGGDSYPINGDNLAVQASTGGRSTTTGAQLEFVIPAGTDGNNPWGQGRIITVAGNANTNDATGKMILGTRRHFNKLGAGVQWYYGNDITIDGSGYVGIGTITPGDRLTVQDAVRVSTSNGTGGFYAADASFGGNSIFSLTRQSNNLALSAFDGIGFTTAARSGPSTSYNMFITTTGTVGINTTNTYGYQFAVNGSVIATSMTVKLYANWPDYVFKPTYHLVSLNEVKTYIDKNNHLPDMPSAEEVSKEGINLGEMNKRLVKKVEELTLYLIQKDKQLNEQAKEIKDIISQIAEIKKQGSKTQH
jgi:hypothetical protein